MMFKESFAIAIKVGGKVLREVGDKVYLPFGSEYSILLKNLNSVRAQANVSVDNQTVIDDVIIPANGEVELERFVKNLAYGNKLKFIERTGAVEDHRGIKIDDGLVRVQFQFEKQPDKITHTHHYDHWHYDPYWWEKTRHVYHHWNNNIGHDTLYGATKHCLGGVKLGATISATAGQMAYNGTPVNNATVTGSAIFDLQPQSLNDVGITVPGSISNQGFTTVAGFPLEEQKYVLILKLLGKSAASGVEVKAPVTVAKKLYCTSCGTLNVPKAKFCHKCGTAIDIVQ